MVPLIDRFLAAQIAFTERVNAITPEQWTLPTPNTAWTVADLVDHVVSEQRWAAALAQGVDVDAAAKIVDEAEFSAGDGADLASSWDEASSAAATALARDGALAGQVSLVRGPTPASDYVRELIFDLVVHSWDLCRAIGYDVMLPSDVVDPVWDEAKEFGDLSSSGLFDVPVEIADDAPTIYRLVAMTGRDPLGAR